MKAPASGQVPRNLRWSGTCSPSPVENLETVHKAETLKPGKVELAKLAACLEIRSKSTFRSPQDAASSGFRGTLLEYGDAPAIRETGGVTAVIIAAISMLCALTLAIFRVSHFSLTSGAGSAQLTKTHSTALGSTRVACPTHKTVPLFKSLVSPRKATFSPPLPRSSFYPQPALAHASAPKMAAVALQEITIPLDTWSRVNSPFRSFTARIHDHGLETISVATDYGRFRRVQKQKGFQTTGTNLVQVKSLVGADVYYVDRIAVESGKCVLKIVSAN